jgi:kinesin family protein 2/24
LEEAGRFVFNEARAKQEAAWAETNINARQIYGAREAQHIYGYNLRKSIDRLFRVRVLVAGLGQEQSHWGSLPPPLAARIMDFVDAQGPAVDFITGWSMPEHRSDTLKICVRKRPLLDFELETDEWDAVDILPTQAAVLCHDGRLSRSGRRLQMTHRRFALHMAWPAEVKNDIVYGDAVQSLVELARAGGSSTLLCMGQTGTGKTHTISGMAECISKDLLSSALHVEVEFFEIWRNKCLDLLAERCEVHLRSDSDGHVHVRGQRIVRLEHGQGLKDLLDQAMQLRASEETERNAASSRSHAICTLRLFAGTQTSDERHIGMLRLVDLAGSERNFETCKMSAAQHRESADINASLMVLKECFRAHAARQRGEIVQMPFRSSRLTRVLQECFTNPEHRTVVIATISPSATDVIHTVNTLLHATMLAKPLADVEAKLMLDIPLHLAGSGSFKHTPVIDWTSQDVLAWLQEAENGNFAHVVVPPNLDGKRLLGTSPQGLAELFDGALREARADNEGDAWTVHANGAGGQLGRKIFAAARRAALAQGKVGGS